LGTWTGGFTPDVSSGRNEVTISTKRKRTGSSKTDCSQLDNGLPSTLVAAPYVADDASGPVEYLTLGNLPPLPPGMTNSIEGTSSANVRVTVGLEPPLSAAALSDPPIGLRVGNPPNTGTLRCSGVNPGASGWADAMQNGCPDPYQVYDESKHTSACGNPPAGVPAADPPDCIDSKPGMFQQKVIKDMWGSPCSATPNHWDGVNLPSPDDPRWIVLFVLDYNALSSPSGKTYPIRRFAAFYVTGASGLGCPGDDPSPTPGAMIWGHFGAYVTPDPTATHSSDLCDFEQGGVCVANLVE
jgi:hypothetical protein